MTPDELIAQVRAAKHRYEVIVEIEGLWKSYRETDRQRMARIQQGVAAMSLYVGHLEAQRDELITALRNLLDAPSGDTEAALRPRREARAVLKAVEGK